MTPQPSAKPAGRTGSEPARHSIRIEMEDGRLRYTGARGEDATVIKVRRGDTVIWQSDHGNHAVLFKSKTPFHDVGFHGHRGNPSMEAKVIGVNDEYHYAVTVVPDDGKPVVDDPVIIVNDGD